LSRRLIRISRILTLTGGSISAVVGILWSLLYVDRLADEAHALTDLRDAVSKRMLMVNAAASQYFIANQQGDLIFILASQGNARRDLAALIYKGNMLDRETPVRDMIGALAIAKQLDYRPTYDAFETLNAAARENLTAETLFALKQREKEIIQQGQALAGTLLTQQFEISQGLNANDAAQHRARVIGGALSIASTLLLLMATLITRRGEDAIPPAGPDADI
jgi:hypothetical protein